MARLTDQEILARYKQALSDWRLQGAIILKGEQAVDGLRTTLEGVGQREFKELLYKFVVHDNGEIDQVKEERENWRIDWAYHYDLRLIIGSVKVYVETRLWPEDLSRRDDPVILVVKVKPA